MVVVEGNLVARQNQVEECPSRRFGFLHKLLSDVPFIFLSRALPGWKVREPEIDSVSPAWGLNYIVTWKSGTGFEFKMN